MSNYFFLLNETPWAGPTAFRSSGADTIMNRGRRLKIPPGPLSYELRVDKQARSPEEFPPLDWHNAPDGQALFSERLVATLSAAGIDNIDYYDASVVYVPTNLALSYRVANLIGITSVIDRARSRFNADEDGFIFELLKIAIDESLCTGQRMFRFRELANMIVISKDVRSALEAASITGTMILEPEDWEPGLI